MSHHKGRSGGVLPINAAATRKPANSSKPSQRLPAPRLRLIVRRLPPGLSEIEFWEGLGSEWQAGKGKVDFFAFKPGKISRDPSKPSRPARAYVKVKDQSLLDSLSVIIKQTQFKDAKNTASDPCLIGPPSLEFAPYNKSTGRTRHDGRQGTIDQDQEFIDFLQSLTEPIIRPVTNGDSGSTDTKLDKVTTTPLVQFIKEKKANKAKEKQTAAAKSTKKDEVKETKKVDAKSAVIVKSNTSAAEKARVAKATQDAVKAISKSVASMQTKTPAKQESKPKEKEKDPVPTPTAAPKRERERGNASVAARMISRDLGLTPKEPRTPRTPKVNAAETTIPEVVAPASIPVPKVTTAPSAPPTGPRNAKAAAAQQQKPQTAQPRQNKSAPQPSTGAKSAFLKHANPSQGVTEELLRTTFAAFGELTKCEIDKKKGLGYVDFVDTNGLKKAMSASPVKVGNGQVVVLENRSLHKKGAVQQRSGDISTASTQSIAGSDANAAVSPKVGKAAVTSPATVQSTIATSTAAIAPKPGSPVESPKKPVTTAPSQVAPATAGPATAPPSVPGIAPSTTPATSPPTAPKSARTGNNAGKGGRGASNTTTGRGGFANRGGRANFRGGRGNRGGRGGGGGAAAATAAASTTAVSAANTTTPAVSQSSET